MVYLLVEPAFGGYPWCQRLLRGLYEEGRKKRTSIRELTSPEEAGEPGCILLAGASQEWLEQMIHRSRMTELHPIVLSDLQSNLRGQLSSKVAMDIHSSMELAVNYLRSLGRNKLALYGVNPSASSDPWREKRFMELTGSREDVYSLCPTVDACFQRFYPRIHRYDAVICASDYAAVSLVHRLRQQGYPFPEQLYIVGYGDMHLARQCKPSITSISDDYEDFGRAALAICGILERNETISSIRVDLNSQLHIRDTTENRPYLPAVSQEPLPPQPENLFFSDPEVSQLARLESLFHQMDDTDDALLRLVLAGASYSRMAEACFISETAAKYRLKKMKALAGAKSRAELAELMRPFFPEERKR